MKRLLENLFLSKEMHEYRKMHNKHRKELTKHAKKSKEYDWCWLHETVLIYIKHMHDYYSAGNNVWQVDESKNEILEQLQQVLDIEKEIEDLNNNLDFAINDPYRYLDKETELYETFYTLIGKYIRYWWD